MIELASRAAKRVGLIRFFPVRAFHSHHYQRHNQRCQEHLASLGLDISGSTVLEIGAGIGDHTSFFLDRGCEVVITEARAANLRILRSRYANMQVKYLDADCPDAGVIHEVFDIVYCYGLLYHLKRPAEAIEFMSQHCRKMLLLETVVSFGDEDSLNPCKLPAKNPTQSVSGTGCRPTRKWVHNRLKQHFPFVYLPVTQPNQEEFPIDWSLPPSTKGLSRSVFIASKVKLTNASLVESIPKQQKHH